MPAKSKSKKRIKPVIEEIVEQTPQPEAAPPENSAETSPKTEEALETADTAQEATPEVQEDNTPQTESKPPQKKTNLKLVFTIAIVSALVAAFVSGGVYVYLSSLDQRSSQQAESSPTPEASAMASATPTPTPAPEVDVSSYSVEVLNGSGKIGAASDGEKVVVAAGFKVDKTGNAGKYDYENTVIQAKDSVDPSAVAKLKDALKKADYNVDVGDKLTSGNYDIVVIVGAN